MMFPLWFNFFFFFLSVYCFFDAIMNVILCDPLYVYVIYCSCYAIK